MTEKIERKKWVLEERSSLISFLKEIIGCVLTGQEVLRGGAKVSVGLLQQLQSVFHRHLHGDTDAREDKVEELKGSAQLNRTTQQGVTVKRVQFSAIHLEDVKKFNYGSSNHPMMKRQYGKSARKCGKTRGRTGRTQSKLILWMMLCSNPSLWRSSLSYVCCMYQPEST